MDGNGGLALGRYRWVHRKIVLWSTFKPRSFTISVTAAITEWVTEIPTHAAEDELSLIMTGGGASPAPRHLNGLDEDI